MLDTKLKSRRRFAGLFLIVLFGMLSFFMLFLYPYVNNKVEKTGEIELPYMWDSYLSRLADANYALYTEAVNKQTEQYKDPKDIYFPMIKEEPEASTEWSEKNYYNYDSLIREFEQEYRDFQHSLQDVGARKFFYEVLDADKKHILYANTSQELYSNRSEIDAYFYIVFSYNENGILSIEDYKGIETEALVPILYQRESLSTRLHLEEWDVKAEEPKNMTFVYAFTEESKNAYLEENNMYFYLSAETFGGFFLLACLPVMLSALVMQCTSSLRMAELKIFRCPFEIAVAAGSMTAALVYEVCNLAAVTSRGLMAERIYHSFLELMGKDADMALADAIAVSLNFIAWFCMFALVFWCASCIFSIFSIGIKKYCSERTIVAAVWRFCTLPFRKIAYFLKNIDLSQDADKWILKFLGLNFIILAIISCFWFFGIFLLLLYSALLFKMMKDYYKKFRNGYQSMLDSMNEMAEGNLTLQIDEDWGMFEPFKAHVQDIQSGFKKAVDEEVKSQHMKTELITNVSHDLKTPLTAIITYVDLLKREDITPEQRASYIDILEKRSLRLKVLIEDLFEVSKANSKNVTLQMMEVDIVNLIKQVMLELSDKIEESDIEFRTKLPEKKILLTLDSQKTFRVFENLIVNIVKYALAGTRAYLTLDNFEDMVRITLKNISAAELDISSDELTERFVRGDQSRNTEGSGLGLAIARSFVEVQGGSFSIMLDDDLFKVCIEFPKTEAVSETETEPEMEAAYEIRAESEMEAVSETGEESEKKETSGSGAASKAEISTAEIAKNS